MSYISKVWGLIDILAEDPFKRYLSFFLASCMRSNLNILGSWIFNIQSWDVQCFFTGNDDGAPNRLKKRREIIFMKFVIASLVTRLNFDESKKLICENCHSVPVIRGEVSRQTFLWQIIFSKDDLGKSAVSISNLSFLPTTKWAWANQPISPASQKTTGAFGFFLGKPSFWLFHQL